MMTSLLWTSIAHARVTSIARGNPSRILHNPSRTREGCRVPNSSCLPSLTKKGKSFTNPSQAFVKDFRFRKPINNQEISLFKLNPSHNHTMSRPARANACERGCEGFPVKDLFAATFSARGQTTKARQIVSWASSVSVHLAYDAAGADGQRQPCACLASPFSAGPLDRRRRATLAHVSDIFHDWPLGGLLEPSQHGANVGERGRCRKSHHHGR
jgi:hypothetical protein